MTQDEPFSIRREKSRLELLLVNLGNALVVNPTSASLQADYFDAHMALVCLCELETDRSKP